MSDPNIDKLYEISKNWITNNSEININNMTEFTIHLMKTAQNLSKNKLIGSYKKEIVLKVIKKVIDDIEWGNNSDKIQVELILEMVMPGLIDNIVDVARGTIDFGKIKKKCFLCF